MLKRILFAIMLFVNVSLFADVSQGETLERQMWDYIKNHQWDDLEKRLNTGFQAVQFDGPRSKEQYMNRVKALNVADVTLNNFQVTENAGVIIVTYNAATTETIEGDRIASNATRLSVWQQNGGVWQWIAHAILIPLPTSDNS